jgi:hypothetical protein
MLSNISLIRSRKGDFRKQIGKQSFVETAPVNLLLVSDLISLKQRADRLIVMHPVNGRCKTSCK